MGKGEYYSPPAEVWDLKKCKAMSRSNPPNSYGDRNPWPGLVQDSATIHGYGQRRFNGGVSRDGEWYEGTDIPWPILHEDYEYHHIPTWGTYIRKKEVNE